MRKNRPKVALVWLKRDLRWEDHKPISKAIDSGYPIVLWYNFEPILLDDKHYSSRHWHFISESLDDFDDFLQSMKTCVLRMYGSVSENFTRLREAFEITSIYSYRETGLKIDPLLIQAVIIVIQCQKIFQEFRFISDDKQKDISSVEVYRVKYMDWLSFYKTHDIFPEFSKLIQNRLNNIQTDVQSIFDTDDLPDSLKTLALKHK